MFSLAQVGTLLEDAVFARDGRPPVYLTPELEDIIRSLMLNFGCRNFDDGPVVRQPFKLLIAMFRLMSSLNMGPEMSKCYEFDESLSESCMTLISCYETMAPLRDMLDLYLGPQEAAWVSLHASALMNISAFLDCWVKGIWQRAADLCLAAASCSSDSSHREIAAARHRPSISARAILCDLVLRSLGSEQLERVREGGLFRMAWVQIVGTKEGIKAAKKSGERFTIVHSYDILEYALLNNI